MRNRILVFLVIVQSILFLAHWFVYETWTAFQPAPSAAASHGVPLLAIVFAVFSVTFLTASVLPPVHQCSRPRLLHDRGSLARLA